MGECVRLLIVEDEPFIAMDLEAIAQARGHEVVGVAASLTEAFDESGRSHPDAAFVDINLSDGFTGVEVARQLVREGVRVGFVTGNLEQAPEDMAGAKGAVEKPFSDESIAELLRVLDPDADGANGLRFVRKPKR
jgi:CheY-like chemotaxis protein